MGEENLFQPVSLVGKDGLDVALQGWSPIDGGTADGESQQQLSYT